MSTIFVFGSNTEGRHGKGAALEARRYGAIYGQPRGRQGDTYAIITKDLSKGLRSIPIESIAKEVNAFLVYAAAHPEDTFLVSPIGCGLAGYKPAEIAPLFRSSPANVQLPRQFVDILDTQKH